jgi:hypothetical protein
MDTESLAGKTLQILRNVEPAPTHLIAASGDGLPALLLFGALGAASLIWAAFALIRRRNVVPLLLCGGAAFAVVNEPIYDLLGKIFYASNHTLKFEAFGRDIPLMLFPGYMAWVAVAPYFMAHLIQSGVRKNILYLVAIVTFVSVVLVDRLGISTGNWTYYGDGPLHGFSGCLGMGPFPIVAGWLLSLAYGRKGVAKEIAIFFIPSVSLAASFACTCFPLYFALHTDVPLALDWLAAALTILLSAGVVWFIGEEVGLPKAVETLET